jgi:CubicO group peptidase (beta-lactamase class C family)
MASVFAFAAPADDLTSTPAGKRVLAYITAFNSGDEAAMRAFYTENIPDSLLAVRSVDDRMQVYRRMHGDIGHMDLERVLKNGDAQVSVLIKGQSGKRFRVDFPTESVAPHKILGIRLMPAEESEPQEAANQPPLPEQAALDSISAMLQRQTAADAFSGVVLIARRGEPLLRKAYGLADREHNVPNTPDTKFNLGSIGKSFTQAAIQRLIADGKLSASDTLGKFLPDYPNADARRKVTVQHLLDHRGGISDFFGEEYVNTPRDRIRSLQDYLPLFEHKPLEFEPGTQEQYSNGGYVLLGLIIEKVSGKNYFDFVKQTVFDPSGMKDSGWYFSDEIVPNRAVGYTHRWNSLREEDSPELRSNILAQPGRGSSAGGGYSTADDLLKYAMATGSGKVLSRDGGQMGIAGGSPGCNAVLESALPGGYTAIILCNLDPPVAEQTARQIRNYLNRIKA